jgi:hypothetical protein
MIFIFCMMFPCACCHALIPVTSDYVQCSSYDIAKPITETSCYVGYGFIDAGGCRELCAAGIKTLRIGNGVSVPLYAAKNTTRAIGIGYNGATCYASLGGGSAAGALNVNIGGQAYHAIR